MKIQIWKIYQWIPQLFMHIPKAPGLKGAKDDENNQFIGTSCAGKSTKIHAVVDGLGNPIHVQTGENMLDSTVAIDVLSHIRLPEKLKKWYNMRMKYEKTKNYITKKFKRITGIKKKYI